jgi:hypothetical protein
MPSRQQIVDAMRAMQSEIEAYQAQYHRNQALIDNMKQLTPRGRLMVFWNRNRVAILFGAAALGWTLGWIVAIAAANAAECPTPDESCKVLILSPQEERILAGPNGILDTAAQARALDLGQFAVYLKQKIAAAPAGDVKEVPKPEDKK